MNTNDFIQKVLEEFEAKYPPFTGRGAPFPIFKDINPNRNHIWQFIQRTLLEHEKLIREEERTNLKERIARLKKQLHGGHVFEVGYNHCKFCNEPRIVVARQRTVLSRDEGSGGEIAEVTERRIDITDCPCPQTPSRLSALADLAAVTPDSEKGCCDRCKSFNTGNLGDVDRFHYCVDKECPCHLKSEEKQT